VLRLVARANGREAPRVSLSGVLPERAAPLAEIWRGPLLRRTLLLSLIWFGLSLGYYGVFTWLPSFFRAQGLELGLVYRNTVLLALAQLPGYALAAFLVERWGRRPTLTLFLLGSAVTAFVFAGASSGTGVLLASALLSFSLLGAWGALYAFTPELYPTDARSTGTGWASGMARLASLLAPALGAALLSSSLTLALGVYAAFFVLAAICTLLMNVETRGRSLA
jgi:putative MFS transporter